MISYKINYNLIKEGEKIMAELMASNFVHNAIDEDLKEGKYTEGIHTRFPPEPNGYLHIGHAKSICLNFGTAQKYNGLCNLRFDDTNPVKEDVEYVDSIQEDVKWLGFTWKDRKYYASDYFEKLYDYAVELIKRGKAYVDDLTADEIREYRGNLTEAGKESPYRNRSVEENLDLFTRMKNGEFADGEKVLRAKIDMASPNITMRDPVIYRIAHISHHRTGDAWCIYPMYDFAHPLSDAIEGITHSICTLEFEDHRPLYDWLLDSLGFDVNTRPRQIEFARLNITKMVMSKRKLRQLVEGGYVSGWDDPRMPTICGFRRRGYSPESIRKFIDKIGYTTYDALNDFALLESAVREDLNARSTRVSAVLNPVKLILTNYPEGQVEEMEAINNPEDLSAGTHTIEFSRELWMERDDFMEDAPKKYFRMTPGQEVRLKNAYIVKCTGCKKDENGNVVEVYAEYDPNTKSGMPEANRKVKGTLHWVSCNHCLKAEVRLYDRLWKVENPRDEMAAIREAIGCSPLEAMQEMINPDSLKVLNECYVEKFLADAKPLDYLQFQRIGYFNVDKDSTPDHLVFNRTVSLKDTWSKINK